MGTTRFNILNGLGQASIDALLAGSTERQLATGEELFQGPEDGEALHLVEEGQLEVIYPLDGAPHRLAIIEAGEHVGELGLYGGGPWDANVRALRPTRLRTLSQRHFQALAGEGHPGALILSHRLAQSMGQRLRQAGGLLRQLLNERARPETPPSYGALAS